MSEQFQKIEIVCLDYYLTLVDLNDPFEKIRKWLFEFVQLNEPTISPEKLFKSFTRYRAVLQTDSNFRLGIDVLLDSLSKACNKYKIDISYEDFKSYCEQLFSTPKAFDDSIEVVDRLKSKFKVGLITNADNYIISESIANQGFNFDFIVTSEDARSNKPDTGIYTFVKTKLNSSYESMLMIGDSLYDDVYGAKQHGMKTIWLNRKKKPIPEGAVKPDFEVKDLSEILNILRMNV